MGTITTKHVSLLQARTKHAKKTAKHANENRTLVEDSISLSLGRWGSEISKNTWTKTEKKLQKKQFIMEGNGG